MSLIAIFRILKRDGAALFTNITGLSFGLATAILLTVFIQYELSFDKHFSNSDRIFRLNTIWEEGGNTTISPINLRGAYTIIPETVAGIEDVVQLYRGGQKEVIFEEDRFTDLTLLYSDPVFFNLFDMETLAGSASAGLKGLNEVIISRRLSKTIFGDENPVGQAIEIDQVLYNISAVVEDVPPNTHFDFDLLMPMKSLEYLENLGGLEFFTYFLFQEGTKYEQLKDQINRENVKLLDERFSEYGSVRFASSLEPLEEIHMFTEAQFDLTPSGNMKTIWILITIAGLVMFLALSNFINLCILSGKRRSREIGIRKVNGAHRVILVKQFYAETAFIVTVAFLIGIAITLLLIPEFGLLMRRESFSLIVSDPKLYVILVCVYVATIMVSGFYPALVLSQANAMKLIRGLVNPAKDQHLYMKVAGILQVTITVFLLIVLTGINTQIGFLKNMSPGYHPEDIVVVTNLNQELVDHYPALRNKLLEIPEVEQVTASGHVIGAGTSGQGIRMYGEPEDRVKPVDEYRIWPGLCGVYRFSLRDGRFMDPERSSDRSGVLLNEAAVEMLGMEPGNIVGEYVIMWEEPMEVIGVLKDFYYESAANKVQPLVLTAYSESIRNIPIRISEHADKNKVLQKIHEAIQTIDEDYIMTPMFVSEIYESYYKSEERMRNILLAGTLLSIIIVIMGIYALSSHNILSRTKEIGIRKVMGASSSEMLSMIYSSTLKWTLLASLIAIPLSWMYLDKWLSNYTERISLSWWIFIIGVVVVLLLQTLITLGKTWNTARKNPVVALRYE